MAKVKEISKAQPQPIKGVWWFKITLDNGEEVFYCNTLENPYSVGDEIPRYEITEQTGRGGAKKILTVLPPLPEEKRIEVTAEFGEKKSIVLAAKARACIEMMAVAANMARESAGKTTTEKAYKALVKMVWSELERI